MKLEMSKDGRSLEITAESIAEAFHLGEFFGNHGDNHNVAWFSDASLMFDLKEREKPASEETGS